MSAKEMFEKLGYAVSDDLTNGVKMSVGGVKFREAHSISAIHFEDREYGENDEYIENESNEEFAKRIGKYRVKEIFFEQNLFEPSITIRHKIVKPLIDDNDNSGIKIEFNGLGAVGEKCSSGYFGITFSPKEIQAINKQIEELGWNNE